MCYGVITRMLRVKNMAEREVFGLLLLLRRRTPLSPRAFALVVGRMILILAAKERRP